MRVLLTLGYLTLSSATPVRAEPITVNSRRSPRRTTRSTGDRREVFTFDRGLIPPGGGQVQDSTFGLHVNEMSFNEAAPFGASPIPASASCSSTAQAG